MNSQNPQGPKEQKKSPGYGRALGCAIGISCYIAQQKFPVLYGVLGVFAIPLSGAVVIYKILEKFFGNRKMILPASIQASFFVLLGYNVLLGALRGNVYSLMPNTIGATVFLAPGIIWLYTSASRASVIYLSVFQSVDIIVRVAELLSAQNNLVIVAVAQLFSILVDCVAIYFMWTLLKKPGNSVTKEEPVLKEAG